MAINPLTLLDGTTAYAHDVEDKVNPLYTDLDDTNIRIGADIQISKLLGSATAIPGKAKLIVSNGTAPIWVDMTGDANITPAGVISVTGGAASTIAITNDTNNVATMYPIWVTANTGSLPVYVSSTKMSFVPNTGVLSCTRFSGPLTGNVTGDCSGNAGTVTNGFYTTSTFYLGTTAIAVNRASASQSLTGISIDGNAGTATTASDATNEAPHAVVKITSGSGNWTVPAGITRLKVIVVGGGGGGADGYAFSAVGAYGGGGGGGTVISDVIAEIVSVSPGDVIAYSVGAGGAHGTPATDGTASVFGAITSGYGAKGGAATNPIYGRGGAGPANVGDTGGSAITINVGGDPQYSAGGKGGGAGGTNGNCSSLANLNGGDAGGYGGGGGGGGAWLSVSSGGAGVGGDGGSGIIIIEY